MTRSDHDLVRVERDQAGVLRVTLDRPETLNALSPSLVTQLTTAFREVAADAFARVVVLAGAGRSFCAGGDIATLSHVANASFEETVQDAQLYATLYEAVANCPVPLIVRVQGAALGGGTALAACADIAIASSEATFGCTEVRVGVIPAVVAPYVLDRLGRSTARRLLLTGERITASEALRLGLIDVVVDAQRLDDSVDSAVESVLKGNPHAQRSFKALLPKLLENRGADVVALSVRASAEFRVSPESREALAAFLRTIGTQ